MGISIKYAKWDGIEKKIRSSIITNTYGVWLQRIQYIFTTMVPWKIRKPEDFLIVKQHWLNARVWHDFSELSTGKITHCTAKCLYILFSHRHRYCMIFIDMLLFYTQSMYCIVLLMNYIVYIYILQYRFVQHVSVNMGGCIQRCSWSNICSWVEHRLEWLCAEMGWSFQRVVVWKIWAAFGYPQSVWL